MSSSTEVASATTNPFDLALPPYSPFFIAIYAMLAGETSMNGMPRAIDTHSGKKKSQGDGKRRNKRRQGKKGIVTDEPYGRILGRRSTSKRAREKEHANTDKTDLSTCSDCIKLYHILDYTQTRQTWATIKYLETREILGRPNRTAVRLKHTHNAHDG